MLKEGDVLIQINDTDVHKWPIMEIAPLMLGTPGTTIHLRFARKVLLREEEGTKDEDASSQQDTKRNPPAEDEDSKPKVPKLWRKGDTPRNEHASVDSVLEARNFRFDMIDVELTRGNVV